VCSGLCVRFGDEVCTVWGVDLFLFLWLVTEAMNGACRYMREVVLSQDQWAGHLGREKAEYLLKKVQAGHTVVVKLSAPCMECSECVMCQRGLQSLIGCGDERRANAPFCEQLVGQAEGKDGGRSGEEKEGSVG